MPLKPELLVTAGTLDELKRLADAGADALVIGDSRFGMRLSGEFDIAAITEAVQYCHPKGIRIYAALNNLMDNELVKQLPDYIQQLASAGVDAVVFGDPAVLMNVRTVAPQLKLHWNAEMTSTNYATANYWGRRGASRVVLARELNLEQVLETKARTELEVQVQVHGITNIYHSKRSLVGSYMDYRADESKASELVQGPGSTAYLIEVERPNERFPIYEDRNGTHIMSSDDICMLESLHELLEAGIDSLKIEGLLKTPAYNEAVVRAYRTVIDDYYDDPEGYEFNELLLEEIRAIQNPHRELSFGFFYKEQVY